MGQCEWLVRLRSRLSGKKKKKESSSLENESPISPASSPPKETDQSPVEARKEESTDPIDEDNRNREPRESQVEGQNDRISTDLDEAVIPDVEEIWDEAYGRIRQNEGMKKLVIEYEKIVRLKLPSATADSDYGGVESDQTPLTRQLAGLDGESRQRLMMELVKASSDNPADTKAFDTFSKVFNSTKDDISSVLAVYPPASIAWTGVCLVLTPLVKYGDQVNANNNGLMYIIAKLPWYAHLVDLLRSEIWESPEQFRRSKVPIKEAIIELYRLVVEFQLFTIRDCHHKFRVIFKMSIGLGPSWEERLKGIQDAELEVEKHMDHDFKTQLLGTLKDIRAASASMESGLMSQLERQFALRQQSTLIAKFRLDQAHLNIDAYQEYFDRIHEPLPGTNEGIRGHKTFQDWESGTSRSLLVVANPGTGKSVLTKSLQELLSSKNGSVVCSFFFKDRGGKQNEINVALCHILYQLFQARPDLIVHVKEDIRNRAPGDIRSNFALLWRIFEKTVQKAEDGSIIILIDALDESESRSREKLLQTLNRFTSPAVKLLCTARPIGAILKDFRPVVTSFLDLDTDPYCHEYLSRDIQLVAGCRLDKFIEKNEIQDEDICQQLHDKLKRRVDGNRTYLFVKLLFEVLDEAELSLDSSVTGWIDEFEKIPESVFDAYNDLLSKIRDKDHETVRVMLEIVLAAQRPLTVQEIEIALKVGINKNAFERGDNFNPALFKKNMLDRCHFFLVTYDQRVYFLHQTVKDYLLPDLAGQGDEKPDKRPVWLKSISTLSCQETLLNSCIRYVSAPFNRRSEIMSVEDFFHLPLFEQLEHQQWYWNTFPFGEYAFCQWLVHLDRIRSIKEEDPESLNQMLQALQDKYPGMSFDVALSMLCCSGFPSEAEARLFWGMSPFGSGNKTDALSSMVQGLILRFIKLSSTADLTCAMEIATQVTQQTPETDPNIGRRLINLSRGHCFLYSQNGDKSIKDSALKACEKAIEVTDSGSIDRARALHEHANFLQWDNIDQAIDTIKSALTDTPGLGESDKKLFSHSLVNLLGGRYETAEHSQEHDLRGAVEYARKNRHGMSKRNPGYGNTLHQLSTWLFRAAQEYCHETEYLDEAIEVAREAKELTLPTERGRPCRLYELSNCLILRYERESNMKDLDDARDVIQEALRTIPNTEHHYRDFIDLREELEELHDTKTSEMDD